MFLGRIDEPRKGLPILLAALPRVVAAVPDLSVLVAGPGRRRRGALRAGPRARRRGWSSSGWSARRTRRARCARPTSTSRPNTGGESFGIILLEAMAAGAPVVASDIEAFQRVLDEGRAGVHFRNEDPEDLAERLIELLGDPARRDALRAAGRERAAQFDWATVARQVLSVYESVTPGGEKVEADLSGQFWGRLPLRRPPWGADSEADESMKVDLGWGIVILLVAGLRGLAPERAGRPDRPAAPPHRAGACVAGRPAAAPGAGRRGAGHLRAARPGERDRAGAGRQPLPQRRPRPTPWSAGSSSPSCPGTCARSSPTRSRSTSCVRSRRARSCSSDLAAACRQVTLSRRFLNDGVQAARLLRQGRLVRLFRLAGNAPRPEMFEMDDVAPPAFDSLRLSRSGR